MKHYPSIPKWNAEVIGKKVIAFDKIDGSNIRAEWNKKQGFYKFGSKTQLIEEKSQLFGEAVTIVKEKWAEDLSLVCEEHKWQNAVFFFEFYGPSSCYGGHSEEPHQLTLIDVNVYKKGMLSSKDFLRFCGHLDIPKVLFEGKIDESFLDEVRNGTLEGMTFEGVVCKDPDYDIMFKVKNQAWLDKLKERCAGDEALFSRLA